MGSHPGREAVLLLQRNVPEEVRGDARPLHRGRVADDQRGGLRAQRLAAERGLTLLVRSDAQVFADWAPGWNALLDGNSEATPFQAPEWAATWTRHLAPVTSRVRVVGLFQGARLVAVAPLCVRGRGADARIAPAGSPITDYQGFLVASDERSHDHVELLASAALEIAAFEGVPGVQFDELREGDALRRPEVISAAIAWSGRACSMRWFQQDACPFVAAPPAAERGGWHRSVATRVQQQLRRLEREHGTAATDVATPETLPERLEDFFRLHEARWSARGESGVLHDEGVRAFHRAFAPAALARGRLRLHTLRVGGQSVAVAYALAHGSRLFYYLGGFDPTHARSSPGLIVLWAAITDALRDADSPVTEIDLLRGNEAYKQRFATGIRHNAGVELLFT